MTMDVRVSAFLLFCLLHLVQSEIVKLSCEQTRLLVDGHNIRRLKQVQRKVDGQPTATGVNYIVWDEELAEKAAKSASNDQLSHDPVQTTGTSRFIMGENTYKTSSDDPYFEVSMDDVLSSWFDQHENYDYESLEDYDYYNDHVSFGHNTQRLFSDSTHVGCGISSTFNNALKEYSIVCYYGLAGNSGNGVLTCVDGHCNNLYGRYCS